MDETHQRVAALSNEFDEITRASERGTLKSANDLSAFRERVGELRHETGAGLSASDIECLNALYSAASQVLAWHGRGNAAR